MTRFTATAIGACGALAALEAARALGVGAPRGGVLLLASVAAVLAATVAIRSVAFVWRGPVIVAFRRREAMLCDAREAGAIRAAAQLRGTLGGAGHLYRWRLVFPAVAWGAASVQALALLIPERSAATFLPLAGVLLGGGLALLWPATAFFYREAAGGCVVAFPSEVCLRLLDEPALDPAPQPVDLGTGMPSRAGELAGPRAQPRERGEPSDGGDEASF